MTIDDAELAALAERDYLAYVDTYADTPGVEVGWEAGLRIRRSAAIDEYLSAVFGARLTPDTADDAIAHALRRLGHDGRAFLWTLWPTDTPGDLADRLRATGFEDLGTDPLMTLDLSMPPDDVPVPPELDLHEAGDAAEIAEIARFAVRSVGWEDMDRSPFEATFVRLASGPSPAWRMFGGWVDGTLVASSALFSGTGMAGIYAVATVESARGRGYGRALTTAAVDAGRAAGASTAVLMASEMGARVYRRLGFRDVGEVRFLRWPGAAEDRAVDATG